MSMVRTSDSVDDDDVELEDDVDMLCFVEFRISTLKVPPEWLL